ncbi:hypothetical protein DSCO28_47050 [Desulfosarcina ovata subsp. sediminis]|uniref:Lipoprotein n=2 Tax=Desulfosarcina ovata TaxID=83564 RepID=A0A5K7ZV83_9BACT|nr:hypothetical protein DSCO28_47050 [Desulfosarcina ovata subsp. sediminis]
MKTGWSSVRSLLLIFFFCGLLMTAGCEGTDTRDQVDDTVKTAAGQKDLERYQQMKEQIGDIQAQETERYRQLDTDTDAKTE